VRRAGAVDDDGAGGPHSEAETATFQFPPQAFAIGRGIPCLQRGGPHVGEPNAGAGFHQPFLRGHRYGLLALDQVVLGHPLDYVGAALFDQPMGDAAGVRSRRRLQAEIERDDEVHVCPASVILLWVNAAAVGSNEAVDAMFVEPALFVVLRADIAVGGQLELALEGHPPLVQDSLAVGGARRRVDVDVIAGAIRPAAPGAGDELRELGVKIAPGDDAARRDHADGLADLGLEEVGREIAAAAAAGRSGDHGVRPLA
jgi:hypothetical protein